MGKNLLDPVSGLSLQRRRGEIVVIGDDIRIEVTGFNGRAVRLRIDAPRHIPVDRLEKRLRQIGVVPGHDAPPAGDEVTRVE